MTPIEQAIAAAAAAKEAQAAVAAGTQVATVNTQGGAVTTAPVAPGKALSMDALLTGAINVDAWFKPKEFGLLIGDNPHLIDAVKCIIDMTDGVGFVAKRGIKAGNPAQYFYTTDGATCTTGGSWEAAQAKARALDPRASEYRCVDLPFTLLEEVKDKKNAVVAEAGKRIGYTTSTTNWKAWEQFYRECSQQGLLGKRVEVILGAERRVNKAGNVWGTMTFQLVGELVAEEAE